MQYITQPLWKKLFKDWLITGCAIRDRHIFYFCLRKDIPYEKASLMWDNEIPTRIVGIYVDHPQFFNRKEEAFGCHEFDGGFTRPTVGIALQPREQGLLSSNDEDGDVFVIGAGGPWPMEYIDKEKNPRIKRMKCIDGYTYAIGLWRRIYKRTDIGQWERLDNGFPVVEATTEMGFKDMDAFSEQDMYAVGGDGDVWHYDGEQWHPCPFPSNEQLSTVLCAPNGYVYIGGEGCSLWQGRGDQWEKVHESYAVILWNELCWFNDKLWLCSDYQLRTWDGNEMQKVMDGKRIVLASGHMDARDGVLIVASQTSVDLFDGKTWRSIVNPY